MDFDQSGFEPGETVDYGRQLRDLSDDQRREYEAACERLEERLQQPGVPLSVLLSEVRSAPPVRGLILIHLGKLWLESERDNGRTPDLGAFLREVPELQPLDSARSELEDWARRLAETKGHSSSSSLDFRGHKFHLPEEYELIDRLQDNPSGMSLVLLVRNKRLGRKEVLKAFNPVRLGEARAVRRFLDEPMKASQTQHQGIIRVWYASQANCPCPYYTMEYLEGGSLADLLKVGPIPAVQAARYFAIVARALHHIHTTLGIAHGDIKPENILLDKEGNPKLTDFGLSRSIVPEEGESLGEGRVSTDVAGTRGFLAPEQVNEQFRTPGYDKNQLRIASDLFALGASLYCCLTCHLPYQQGARHPSWFAAVDNDLVPVQQLNPAVDNKLDAITQKCLQKRPEHRFSTAAELAGALEAWLSHQILQEVVSEDTTFPPKASKRAASEGGVLSPRRRQAATAACVAVLALAAVLWLRPRDPVPSSFTSPVIPTPKVPPVGKAPPKAPPAAPFEEAVADVLQRGGWGQEAAEAVAELNAPWLDVVRKADPRLARDQVARLARLGSSDAPLDDLCREAPHCAALLATVETDDDQSTLAGILGSADPADPRLAERLFTLYPSPGEAQALAESFKNEVGLLRDLGRRGWLGAEVALFPVSDTEADRAYNEWVRWIVRKRLAPADTDESRRRAAEFQAFAALSGPSLRVRLTNNQDFRRRFLEERGIWLSLVSLVDEGAFTLNDILGVDEIWDYLAHEGEAGRDLLRDYKLAPVALLYGSRADDFKGLHDRVRPLLRSNNKSVIQALFEDCFRGNLAFRKLLEKDVPVTVLAVALEKARQEPGKLNTYAELSAEDLKGELEPFWNPQAEENVKGYGVYIEVPRRLLAGERVHEYQQRALFKQAVSDVAAAVLICMGATADVQQGFNWAYSLVISGADAVEKAKREAVLKKARELLAKGELPALPEGDRLRPPLDLAGVFVDTCRLMGQEQPAQAPDRPGQAGGFDVATVVRLYKSLLFAKKPRENAADRLDVRLYLMPGGRLAVAIERDAGRRPNPVREFFNSRAARMSRSSSGWDEGRERAWRESVSAWWLLHATGQLNLLEP
jgi:serine/threonine protein kinase